MLWSPSKTSSSQARYREIERRSVGRGILDEAAHHRVVASRVEQHGQPVLPCIFVPGHRFRENVLS